MVQAFDILGPSSHQGGVDPETISRIARDLLADARGSVGDSPVAVGTIPAPARPAPIQSPAPPPSASPADPIGDGTSTSGAAIRDFVRRIRGLDHRSLPDLPVALSTKARAPSTHATAFDVESVRRDFPILRERIHGRPLIWLDNAATTQKPQAVIDAVAAFYTHDNSNIHRGAHTLAARATDAFESARGTVQRFLGAAIPEEIVFVRGCTEGINLVAASLGASLRPGDEILLTELEHHANIVPWQMAAERTGASIRVAPIDDRGELIVEAYARLLGPRTRIVALSHASNSLGTILPVEMLTAMAKAAGARVLVDGAQSVAHFPVDVRAIGCDFFVFSGHKVFGPTGIGAVFIHRDMQESLPPWQGGGNMIHDVTFARTTYAAPPAKFEAGTPNVADAIGLAAALDYVSALGRDRVAAYEHLLLERMTTALGAIEGVRIVGTARHKVGVVSFIIPGIDPLEIGRLLDQEGIAVRAGHHCAQPSLRHFGLEATVRPALAFTNTIAEIEHLASVVARIARRR